MTQNGIKEILLQHPIIPVVTLQQESDVHTVAKKLAQSNISCAEVTLRTEYALEGIQFMKVNYPEISIGVGTVVDKNQIAALQDLAVSFMVSPGSTPELLKAMENSGIAYLPGAVTPSEIISGMGNGVSIFKFFPANLFGGIATLQTYGQVFSQCSFCPTGGLNAGNHKDFLALKNVLAVGGSWMLK
ncbi:MAG: bifunctional 4-hydroxy-2-oxoglutarate aldolase/2-dehydro-3-deoxy-phosphogluconate aldolase [Crocinitomicaceae bacterium]|nr:bifunctional 4-hydroxy-2-oxoglutarate aldolase/2-dehydro-3-deoxy-phosphogluconate aldolase [Crocinitomicaceae bacterium]